MNQAFRARRMVILIIEQNKSKTVAPNRVNSRSKLKKEEDILGRTAI